VSSLWNRFLAGLTVVAAFLALLFFSEAKRRQAEAERERLRAQVAEGGQAARQRADDARRETQQLHAEERADIEAGLAEGRRDQLEKKW
jgi:hypothetical protein